jgi:hypothetical protein
VWRLWHQALATEPKELPKAVRAPHPEQEPFAPDA